MKQLSNRGAARVGAVWIIVVIVLFFVALGYAYVANQEATAATEARDQAVTERNNMEAERDAAATEILALTRPVGYNDTAVIGSKSDPSKVAGGVASLVSAFALGDSIDTFEEVVNPVMTAYASSQREVQTQKNRVAELEDQIVQDKAKLQDAAETLRREIATLKREKTDETQALQARVDTLEADLATMTADRNAKDDELNAEKGTSDKLTLDLEQEKAQATSIQTNLNNKLTEMERRAETPDGAVLSVSKELGIGWINRGTKDRVSEGMVFEIRTGHPNPSGPATKAKCEVLRVNEATAEVRIFDQADPYDPVVQDDLILNPIYDPGGDLHAVLAGRFGGTYNQAELTLMLEEIGITVQKSLDLTTNYLIVGQPLYIDENGEPYEDPLQPSELPVYKDAQAQGCKIISINEFKQFFRR